MAASTTEPTKLRGNEIYSEIRNKIKKMLNDNVKQQDIVENLIRWFDHNGISFPVSPNCVIDNVHEDFDGMVTIPYLFLTDKLYGLFFLYHNNYEKSTKTEQDQDELCDKTIKVLNDNRMVFPADETNMCERLRKDFASLFMKTKNHEMTLNDFFDRFTLKMVHHLGRDEY